MACSATNGRSADESWVVAINVTGEAVELAGADSAGLAGRTVALATDMALEGRPFTGTLMADGGVVLAPRGPAGPAPRRQPPDGVRDLQPGLAPVVGRALVAQ